MDIWAPSFVNDSNGCRYYITFLDIFSKFTWIYLIQNKSQVVFKRFKTFVENQTGCKIRSVQYDNAKEFLAFTSCFTEHDIHHRLICHHTHQQNGSIERKHRHITESGLALLVGSLLPLTFWGEAFVLFVHIINVLPALVLQNLSPYEILFKKKPDYNFYKVFGCACYSLLRPYHSKKFNFHSSLCLFLGYSFNYKGYI